MRDIVFKLVPFSCAAALGSIALTAAAQAPITLIGTGRVPATSSDGQQLVPPVLEDGTPHDRVGGFGSAITYTGVADLYLATPDRGPDDGKTSYQDRAYLFSIAVKPGDTTPVQVTLQETNFLTDEKDRTFVGTAAAIESGLRFDPEGVRLDGQGGYFVSDEYGPFVYRFSAEGTRTATLSIPSKFTLLQPNADPALELTGSVGRQANRGMEGLAITPDGSKLYGMMQNALLQDGALDVDVKRVGLNNRLLQIDLASKKTRELVYTIDDKGYGVNEILAINDHEFLAIERDGATGAKAVFKRLVKFDITGATDVSGIAKLPVSGLPSGVKAVAKTGFLDLLDPAFGLAGETFPEKIEGITFGPKLADGRVLLLVSSDNDFADDKDSLIFAFAIDPKALAWQPQTLQVPAKVVNTNSWDKLRNLQGRVVPVVLSGQALLPVTAIDRNSLRLASATVLKVDGKPLCLERDQDRDGIVDLLCAFSKKELRLDKSADTKLTAQTTTGTPLRGNVPTRDCQR